VYFLFFTFSLEQQTHSDTAVSRLKPAEGLLRPDIGGMSEDTGESVSRLIQTESETWILRILR